MLVRVRITIMYIYANVLSCICDLHIDMHGLDTWIATDPVPNIGSFDSEYNSNTKRNKKYSNCINLIMVLNHKESPFPFIYPISIMKSPFCTS